jgi:hypothetical protein
MGLSKGMTNNPNGRPKGIPNKSPNDLRQWVGEFIEGQREQIVMDWKTLEPKDRIIMFEKLMRFVLPTLQANTVQTDFERLPDDQLDYIINELKQQVAALKLTLTSKPNSHVHYSS